jgi:ABC-type glycerol-3-phosphate transport system substrate-binding protein
VTAADFIDEGKVYAAPLSVETLGLYYNKDLFNQAGITSPPTNWNEFIDDVRKLTKVNAVGEITTAGAAIGTAYNINRSTDILNLLMLQNGTNMTNDSGRISFDNSITADGKTIYPGENALNFYTQFASAGSGNYTWNPSTHYSIDAFSEGTVAMMFNYSWHMSTIAEKSPKLNFSVVPVPQFENSPRVNYANYWAFAVAKNKIPVSRPYGASSSASSVSNDTRVAQAWLFLTYLTTKPDGTFQVSTDSSPGRVADPNFDPAKSYLADTGEPAARRDLIEIQKSDPKIGVFAADNLIARSWRQPEAESMEAIFAEMIDQVNRGQETVSEAIKTAARRAQVLSGR